ncbi:hypothetical protein CDD82_717 [Ophiocordyceps australis]|uniref:Secreted protein n=1 Tax=Ophiocordyceps australis TaxID=1399860 RepID=A0A2C5YKS8_9HYPO|nr:hypothetical protein CDD82_717 [Ophiocordyceps australis]
MLLLFTLLLALLLLVGRDQPTGTRGPGWTLLHQSITSRFLAMSCGGAPSLCSFLCTPLVGVAIMSGDEEQKGHSKRVIQGHACCTTVARCSSGNGLGQSKSYLIPPLALLAGRSSWLLQRMLKTSSLVT